MDFIVPTRPGVYIPEHCNANSFVDKTFEDPQDIPKPNELRISRYEKQRQERTLISVLYLLTNYNTKGFTLNKMSKELTELYKEGYSKSNIQRYLKNNYILNLPNGKIIMEYIELILTEMRLSGRQRGGFNSQLNYTYTRDKNGKFTGMKKR